MAGNKRIAGITIEIGGDTTKLQTALKDVDKQLSTTQNNLKDVNKLLKLNPGNTELLTQKQKNLESAIKDTKDRLEKLKDAQKEYGKGTAEYDAIQREIIETENNLKDLEKEYKEFGSVAKQKIQAVGSAIKDAGKNIGDFGKKWTTHVTAPIAAIGGLSYKAFTEVDEGLDTIIKKTGATGDSLDEMGDIMKDIANSIPTDFATAGEAVGEVNTRFGVTGDTLRGLSEQYVKFAEINDTDVTGAIDSTQKALAAFGLDAASADSYLNALTATSQRTGISVDTLAAGAVQNATAFKEMGLDIYGATAFMGDLEVSGADSSAVMSGLGKALKNATAEGIPLDQALADLQNTILNGTESTDGLTAAYELFGKNGAQVYEAVKNGTLDFTNLGTAVDEAGNIVTDTFDATLDPADQFKVAMNNIKTLGAEIAETVMPWLSEALAKVRDIIVSLREKWEGLSEPQRQTIIKIAGVIAAIGPVLTMVGSVTSAIGGVIGLLTGPAGIVVAIAAVVAAGVWLVENWDEVKEKIKEVWEKIKGFFVDAWEKIKAIDWAKLGREMWNNIKNAFSTVTKWFKEKFDAAWDAIKNIKWADVGSWIWDKVTAAFTALGSIKDWFKERFDDAWDAIKKIDWGDIASTIWDKITTGLAGIGEWLLDIFRTPINSVIDMVNGMIGGVEGAFNAVVRGLNKLNFTVGGGEILGVKIPEKKIGISGLKEVSFGRLDHLYNGGIVGEGGAATVGEYAPEMLRVINGQAVVTPLPGAERWGSNDEYNFNIYTQPGQSAQQIAAEVQKVLVRQQQQRRAAYA